MGSTSDIHMLIPCFPDCSLDHWVCAYHQKYYPVVQGRPGGRREESGGRGRSGGARSGQEERSLLVHTSFGGSGIRVSHVPFAEKSLLQEFSFPALPARLYTS